MADSIDKTNYEKLYKNLINDIINAPTVKII